MQDAPLQPFFIKIFVSIFEWPFYTYLTVLLFCHSEIQPFVPCVEENREDFLDLMNCSASILASEMGHIWGDLLTIEEQLDLILGIFDAVNNILCNRIDGNEREISFGNFRTIMIMQISSK